MESGSWFGLLTKPASISSAFRTTPTVALPRYLHADRHAVGRDSQDLILPRCGEPAAAAAGCDGQDGGDTRHRQRRALRARARRRSQLGLDRRPGRPPTEPGRGNRCPGRGDRGDPPRLVGRRQGRVRRTPLPPGGCPPRAQAGPPDRDLAGRIPPADAAPRGPQGRRLDPVAWAAVSRRSPRRQPADRRSCRGRRPRSQKDPAHPQCPGGNR